MLTCLRRIGLIVVVGALYGWAHLALAQVRDSSSVVQLTTHLSQDRLRPGDQFQLALRLALEPGWHLNANEPRSEFLIPTLATFDSHPAIRLTKVRYPQAIRRRFAFAEQPLDVYEGSPVILATALVAKDVSYTVTTTLTGRLSLQACDETTCLAPATIPFEIPIVIGGPHEAVTPVHPEIFGAPGHAPNWMGRMLKGQALWMWFLAAFIGGLALNLTPCVYPMIPVTLAFFSGQAAGRVGSIALLGMLYVVGMSLSYAVLGFVAAQTGALLGSWLQQPIVLIAVACLVGILALSMFGLYELRPPRWLAQRLGQSSSGRVGAFAMGVSVGLIAAPCIGPFVLGLLLFASQLESPLLGFGLFFMMGIGMGLPYLLVGVFANRMGKWPKAGMWLVWVKKLLGVVLLGLALYFLKPLMAPGSFRWLSFACLVLAGLYLGWLERSRFQGLLVWVRRLVGLAMIGGAIALIPARQGSAISSISWQPYSPARLEQARRSARPVLIDIYADWCLPCVELDHVTFRHSHVVERLSEFVTLRVDATREIPLEAEDLLDRYEVYGVPTVLVFDAEGRERPDLRVQGFVTPKELLARLAKVSR